MDEQDELVKEFLIESFEYLDALDEDLLSLEKGSADQDLLARIFRALHTIKGTGGFLDFDNLVSIAHAGEGLLDCLRNGSIEASEEVSDSLFNLVDAIRDVLHSIEETGKDGEKVYTELVKTLISLQGGRDTPAPAKLEKEPAAVLAVPPIQEKATPAEPVNTQTSALVAAPSEVVATGDQEEEPDDEFGAYLFQTNKFLDNIQSDIQTFPLHPLDTARIERIQTNLKSIVGSSSIMGYRKLISTMLSVRKNMDGLKSGELVVSGDVLLHLAAHIDAAKQIVANIEQTETENVADFRALINDCLTERKKQPAAPSEGISVGRLAELVDTDESATEVVSLNRDEATTSDNQKAVEKNPVEKNSVEKNSVEKNPAKKNTGEQSIPEKSAAEKIEIAGSATQNNAAPNNTVSNNTAPNNTAPNTPASYKTEPKSNQPDGTIHKRSLADNNIRVNVDLLDALMNLVGELVLTRNQILQFTSTGTNPAFANSAQNLDLITTELQEGVMKTRMQTIGTIWKKFPRIVHDLAKACDKKANVEMEGKDTELDKTIIEAIKDPLTHLVRNAIDHGIETPAERVRVGKTAAGNLRLRAFHEGGHVNIEISDDGAGIDPERIKQKAIANGLINQAQASRMSDREILNLIFVAGFSTAQQVSNISGRGVGMDVVKTYIERIGGTVDINSKVTQGTTIKIKIPLTLAIIPALIIKVCKERFALPQVNLLELVRLEGEQIESSIELIHDTPVYRLRGKLLPLIYLNRELGLKEEEQIEKDEDELVVINIVVLQAEDQPFGLVVNEVVDTEEVVVKPLTKLLKHQTTFAGATIMGDGKIALILDVVGLARKGGVMSQNENIKAKMDTISLKESAELTTLLLARINPDRQVAIPLSMISRLEEIESASIEKTGKQEIIQYRGHLMPLIRLANLLDMTTAGEHQDTEQLQVIVIQKNGVNIGMIVDEIVDIVEEQLTFQDRPGLVKCVSIIQQRATDLLSVQEILDSLDTGVFELEDVAN